MKIEENSNKKKHIPENKILTNNSVDNLNKLTRNTLDNLSYGIIIKNKNNLIVYINKYISKITEYSKNELLGLNIDLLLPNDTKYNSEKLIKFEDIIKNKSDNPLNVDVIKKPIDEENYILEIEDITSRKELESKQKQDEDRLLQLTELLPSTIYEMDFTGKFTYFNKIGFERTGYTEADLEKGIYVTDLVDPEYIQFAKNNIKDILSGNRSKGNEYIIRSKKNEKIPVLIYSCAIIQNNKPVGIRGSIVDISQHKQIEKALSENERKYRDIIDDLVGSYFQTDTEGNIIFVTPSFYKLFAYPNFESLVKKNIVNDFFKTEDDKNVFNNIFKNRKDNKGFVVICLKKDLSEINIEINIKFNFDKKNTFIGTEGIVRDITNRIKDRERIKESEKNLKNILGNANEAIFILQDNALVFTNPATEYLLRVGPEKLTQKPFIDFVHPDHKKMVESNHIKAIKGQNAPAKYSIKIIDAKNNIKWIQVNTKLIKWKNKPSILIFSNDITNLINTQITLKESQERLGAIINSIPDIIYYKDDYGKYQGGNKKFNDFFRISNKEVLGLTDFELFPKEKAESNKLTDNKILHFNNTIRFEEWLTQADGKQLFFETVKTPYYDNRGNILGLVGISRDITQKKEAEEKFRNIFDETNKTQELLKNVIDATDDIIFAKDNNNKYLLANKNCAKILNSSTKDLVGKTDEELIDVRKNNSINQLQKLGYKQNPKRDKYISLHTPVVLPDGTEKIFQTQRIKLYNADNEIFATLIFAHDITRMVRAEKELLNINLNLEKIIAKRTEQLEISEQNFKNLFDKSNDAITLTSMKGDIIDVNEKMYKMLEYTKDEFLNLKVKDLTFSKYNKERGEILYKIKDKGFTIFETVNISKTGKKIPLEISSTLLNYKGKDVLLSAGRDITDRKEMQKQILKTILRTEESERKRFAKELHDGLGALLSGIKMYVDVMAEEKIGKDEIPQILAKTKELIDEAADTTREVANNIKPHVLTNLGLPTSIKVLCDRFNDTNQIYIDFNTKNYTTKLNDDFELTIYRVISELINNTIKHGQAKKITLNLRNTSSILTLLYTDNGIGFDVEKMLSDKTKGNGLKNIFNRIETVNGTCEIISNKEIGVYVRIKVDIKDFLSES